MMRPDDKEVAALQGLVDDLIRTFDGRPQWQMRRTKTQVPRDKDAAGMIAELEGIETLNGGEPLTLGEMFAITDDGHGIMGVVFGTDRARYIVDLTNLLIRITEHLRPALAAALSMRERMVKMEKSHLDLRALIARTIDVHELMGRVATQVLQVDLAPLVRALSEVREP